MTKPDHEHAPEEQSRENAVTARKIEEAGGPTADVDAAFVRAAGRANEVLHRHRVASHAIPEGKNTPATGTCWVTATTTPPPAADTGTASHDTNRLIDRTDAWEQRADDKPAASSQQTSTQDMGNVPPTPAPDPPATDRHARTREITKRLQSEGRWFGQAEATRDTLMRESKGRFETKEQAQAWVYSELDRMYPPVQSADQGIRTYGDETDIISESPHLSPLIPTKAPSLTDSDTGQIQGLSDVPGDWPSLPANASLSAEIGWVQANRLFMVEERPGKATRVRLDQAASPAPSRASLGWLETSIRSYAKFVDVAAKVSGGDTEESAVMKRERRSVEEVRALIQEMQAAEGTCPHCRRPY